MQELAAVGEAGDVVELRFRLRPLTSAEREQQASRISMQATLLELLATATGARVVPANLHGMPNGELSNGIIEDSVAGKGVDAERVAKKV
jgi:hypothetical protein